MVEMTEEDLRKGLELADSLVERLTKDNTPAAAVAAAAIALAALARLSKCGPNAPVALFQSFYARLS